MNRLLVKLVAMLLLVVQVGSSLIPGRVYCLSLHHDGAPCMESAALCGCSVATTHDHATPHGHGHDHGPLTLALHAETECGCHIHVPVPNHDPAPPRGGDHEPRPSGPPLVPAVVACWESVPRRIAASWHLPAKAIRGDLARGLSTTRLLI